VDPLAGGEGEGLPGDGHGLFALAFEVHFHPSGGGVVERPVGEAVEVEIDAEFTVAAGEQVQVEGGGDAGGVVVGRVQHGRVLLEVDADQQAVAAAQLLGHLLEEAQGLQRREVADAGAGEKRQTAVL